MNKDKTILVHISDFGRKQLTGDSRCSTLRGSLKGKPDFDNIDSDEHDDEDDVSDRNQRFKDFRFNNKMFQKQFCKLQ
jgi:hypothetical protein